MDLTFSEQETAFRDELRGWLAENQPDPKPTEAGEDAVYRWRQDWQRRLYDAGWAAPHWPVEYGGRGARPSESAIYFEELGRARVPMAANVLGLLLGGPTLMVWGTDEQKERYLAPILSAYAIDAAPAGSVGAAMGMLRTVIDLAIITGPAIIGALVDQLALGYAAGLWLCGVLLGLATLLFWLARPTAAKRV